MKSTVKYALIFAGLVIVLAGTCVAMAVAYRNEIVKAVLSTVAQNNDIDFNASRAHWRLSRNLTKTSLRFDSVEVKSKVEDVSANAFSAQAAQVGVEVDLLSFVLRKELKIEKISISNGSLLLRPARKKAKVDKELDVEQALAGVKHLAVENFTVYVQDAQKISKTSLEKISLQLSSNKGLQIKAKGSLAFELLDAKGKNTLPRTGIALEATGKYAGGTLTLGHSKLNAEGVRLSAAGELGLQPFGKLDVTLNTKGLNLEKTLPLVRRYAALKELEGASGKSDISLNLSGSLSERGKIKISSSGSLSHGSVKLQGAENISVAHLNYLLQSNDINCSECYSCEFLKANVRYLDFELGGSAAIANFSAPRYSADATFKGDVKTLKIATLPEGEVVGNLRLKAASAKLDDIEQLEVLAQASGLKALVLESEYLVNGEIFAGKESATARISVESQVFTGDFEGKIKGYLPPMLDSTAAGTLDISGRINAEELNLDKLMAQEGNDNGKLSIRAVVDAQAKEMLLLNESFLNTSANVYYDKAGVTVGKLTTTVYGSKLSGEVKIGMPEGENKNLNMNLYFSDLEILKFKFLHKQFKLKEGSILGSAEGNLRLRSAFDEKGLDTKSMEGTLDFTISNGQLVEFEPILPLSKYIKPKLLQDVKFSALRNSIGIANGAITIPKMEIRSTALNTYVSGRQEFSGDFDYHLTLFVSELLRQKSKNIENPIREDKTKLFLRFTSKNGKVDVSHDSEEWSKNFEKKLQREADEIRASSGKPQGGTATTPSAPPQPDKVEISWEEEPREEKKPEKPQPKEEKKKSAPAVQIEWEE